MNNEFVKTCSITQNKEEYICMNEQCCSQNRKQLHCYECITKIHRQNNNNNFVNHLDDFKKINVVMQEIEKRKKERVNFINQIITSMNDFKKEKFQIIESYQNNPKEFLEQVKSYIEKEIDQFIQKLYEQIMEINKFTEYQQQYHSLFLKLYQQKLHLYIEDITQKKGQLQLKLNNYIKKMDLDLHQQIAKYLKKQQVLEQQVQSIIKQPSMTNFFLIKYTIFLILLIIGLNSIFIFNNLNERNQFQQKIEEFNIIIKGIQEEIETKKDSACQQEFDGNIQQQMNKVWNYIDTINYRMNQTEIPFNQYKNYFETKLKQYNESTYNTIIEKINIQLENLQQLKYQFLAQNQINDKIMIENNRTASVLTYQQIRVMEIEDNLKIVKGNFSETLDSIEQIKILLLNNLMKIHKKLQFGNRQEIIEKLVGKIHVELNVKELDEFILIYDGLLNKQFNRRSVRQIQSVTQNDTILCVGGMKVDNPEILTVAGCDYQEEIFQYTYHWQYARKSQSGDIYWYLAFPVAFGFSPKEEISLTLCDDLDPHDQRRFSYWFENGIDGGRRIGNQTQLINSVEYKMIIFAF